MNRQEKAERREQISRLIADRDYYAHQAAHAVFMGAETKARDYADAYERACQQLKDLAGGKR